ncbi:hypothetical protein DPEC_G00296510 [Dallia pectoralis]|uniref:Uncharacterized protein n=1 Tax=Dallia pectoralis TaxID=75939 RepID=A0ACC2FFD0_DALPE|nr:hypothetical protein DPEC_G00296510 [Dallia pectoralis]
MDCYNYVPKSSDKMVKKRQRAPKEVEEIDLTGPSCSHIRKGFDHGFLKKIGIDWSCFSCQDCRVLEKPTANTDCPSDEDGEETSQTPTIWMCLKCGHRGCGRNSEDQHAMKHYEKPRSDPHCLVLSLDNWSVWCYICDDDVHYSKTGCLAQLVTNIKKQALSEPRTQTLQRKLSVVKLDDRLIEPPHETKPEVIPEIMKGKENTEPQLKETQKKNFKKESRIKESLTSVNNGQSDGGGASRSSQSAGGGATRSVSVRGLSNLGNTCFFNAVVQNLSQTEMLRQVINQVTAEQNSSLSVLLCGSDLGHIHVQLAPPGSLTVAMCQTLNEIQETNKGVVTPKELFSQVCKKAVRFKGFQQQDSQELLRYLLDGMRAEEIKRVSSGISEALKIQRRDVEQSKKLVKEYERSGAPKTFVDQVFGGELTSTVMCQQCKTVSLVKEMFLDLSLPVSDEAYRKKSQKKGNQKASPDPSPVQMANGDRDDLSTEMGSKYQQKKQKKQAKKQTKSQRRQQRLDGKVTLDNLTSQEDNPETPDPVDLEPQEDTPETPDLVDLVPQEDTPETPDLVDLVPQEDTPETPDLVDLVPQEDTPETPDPVDLEPQGDTPEPPDLADLEPQEDTLGGVKMENGTQRLEVPLGENQSVVTRSSETTPTIKDKVNPQDSGCREEDTEMGVSGGDRHHPDTEMGVSGGDRHHPDTEMGVSGGDRRHPDTEMGVSGGDRRHPDTEMGVSGGDRRHPDTEMGVSGGDRLKTEHRTEEENRDGKELEDGKLAVKLDELCLNEAFLASEEMDQKMDTSVDKETEKEYTVSQLDPEQAFHTLASRAVPEKQECSVQSCLYQFTEVEMLTQNNCLLCVICTKQRNKTTGSKTNVYTEALKQMLISSPPPVLTLHLKRFQQVGYSVCKVNRHVLFPPVLDLTPFCSVNCKGVSDGVRVLYSLYGVVEHSGTMRGGHYTAYVKARPPTQSAHNGVDMQDDPGPLTGAWFHVSDSSVQPVSESKVQSSQAYLLFYERIS